MTGPFTLLSVIGAVLSDDRAHRYWLWRIWDRKLPVLVACMFNPSTADASKDDPTISRLCDFARRWGYGGVLVINLYSARSADPDLIRVMGKTAWGDAQPEAIGAALEIAAQQGTPVLAAWGALASRADELPFLAAAKGIELVCLELTGGGSPTHPMARGKGRVPPDRQPIPFVRA